MIDVVYYVCTQRLRLNVFVPKPTPASDWCAAFCLSFAGHSIAACAGDLPAFAAKCGKGPAVVAAALEVATRQLARSHVEGLSREPAGGSSGSELLHLPLRIKAAVLQEGHQRWPERLLPEQRGLYVTCIKAAAARLGTWLPPLAVLCGVTNICQMLPVAQLTAGPSISTSSGASSSAGSASASARRSHTGSITPALVLLCGRTLYTAGRALQQVHERPGIVETPTSSSSSSSSTVMQTWQLELAHRPLSVAVALPLLGCVAVVEPALQQAVAESASSGSSSSSSSSNSSSSSSTAAQQLLQLQQELQATLAGAAQLDSGASSAEADAAAAEADVRANLTADTAQQLVDLGSGICVHLAAGQQWCCANPSCTSLADALERQLVAGKGTVCSACRSVRVCGPACHKAYWKAGHKQVCALFKQRKSQQGQQ
jgi:hypothetical protein